MNYEADVQKVQHALLDEVLIKGIQRNEEQYKIWRTYRDGHEKVAEALQTFQKDVHVNCMIPVGKRALMKGRLIHTNEVLAFLGDGYFVKYSTTGATALCQRRIQRAEEMLKNLSAERDLYETRMMVLENNFFEDCAGREIIEHWNEDQIEEWKKKHREREREYHKQLGKFRQEERKQVKIIDDLFSRLDELEIEEELADELNRLEDEGYNFSEEELGEGEFYYETESSSESEQNKLIEIDKLNSDSGKQHKETVESNKPKKSVSFQGTEDDNVDKKENKDLIKIQKENCEEIEDTEYAEEDISRIEFSHSSNNPVIKSNGDSITSPADIYKMFSKPKSILKRSPNYITPVIATPIDYSTEEDEEEEQYNKPSAYETLIKDIKERDTTTSTNDALPTEKDIRPVSKFKKDRQRK